jgi:MFS family permease
VPKTLGDDVSDATKGRYRNALRERDFRLLVVSFIVDQIGSWSYSVVIAVYLFDRTHSTQWLATAAASRWLTGLLMSGYGGVIADRYERTRVMIGSAVLSTLVMAGMTVAIAEDGPLLLLIGLSVLGAAALSPYRPAAGALTPEIVGERDLAAANSLFNTLENVVVVVGPGIGGLLLLTGKPAIGAGINAASFALAVVVLSRLRVRSTGGAGVEGGGALAQWMTGLRALMGETVAVTLVVYCALDSAVYGASSVVFVPLSEHLGTGTKGYSYLLGATALGGVLAAGLANRLSSSSRLALVIFGSISLQALPYLVTIPLHSAAPAIPLMVLSGAGMIIVDVLAITALQRDLPRAVLSRVLGVFDAVILLGTVVASFIASLLLEHTSLTFTLVMMGVGFPAVAALGLPVLIRADLTAARVVAQLRPRVELLEALDLFAGVDRPALERLAAGAEEHSFPARHVLITEGEAADALWILVSGSLTVRARGDAETARQLPPVQAPGYVGELGLLHGVPRTATVRTREAATVLRSDGSAFLECLETAPASPSLLSIAGARMARTPSRRNPVTP